MTKSHTMMMKPPISFLRFHLLYFLSVISSWWDSFQLKPEISFLNILLFVSMLNQYRVDKINSLDLTMSQLKTTPDVYTVFKRCFQTKYILIAAVYGACATVILQFTIAICLLHNIFLPYGFSFLIACMCLMANIYCKCCVFFYFNIKNNKSNIISER